MNPELIVLDLDGTLIDSAPDLGFAVEKMLEELDLQPASAEQIRSWIGNGVTMLVKRALSGKMNPGNEVSGFDRALEIFSDVYEANICDRGRVYPGVLAGLQSLKIREYTLACLTNKHSRFTSTLLRKAGLLDYFDFVASGDTFEYRKPHPMPLLKTADRFGARPESAVMVGDSVNDIEAAKAAGFTSVCVPYGYPGAYSVEELGADYIVDSLDELVELFTQAA